ncbi:MAG: hypothetical protein AAGI66_03525 [Cyanobacteria bacterium P01_H01_bin.74]
MGLKERLNNRYRMIITQQQSNTSRYDLCCLYNVIDVKKTARKNNPLVHTMACDTINNKIAKLTVLPIATQCYSG